MRLSCCTTCLTIQACHLPNVNPSNPGKMIDYIAHPDLANNFPDQVSPFRCFGCNFAEPFKVGNSTCFLHDLPTSAKKCVATTCYIRGPFFAFRYEPKSKHNEAGFQIAPRNLHKRQNCSRNSPIHYSLCCCSCVTCQRFQFGNGDQTKNFLS